MPALPISSGTLETSVLVVGGGPTGLVLASELGRRGVSCILVEQAPADAAQPGASLLDVQSLEWLRRVGLRDAVRDEAISEEIDFRLYCTSLNGYEIARVDLRRPSPVASPEHPLRVNQIWLAPLLRELAESHAETRVHFRWRLDHLKQRGDCILAEISDLAALERRRVAAQYVVDCTGASSAIRAAHGMSFGEALHEEAFAQLDLRIAGLSRLHGMGLAAETVLVDAGGMWRVLECLDGRDRYRLRLDGEAHWDAWEAVDPVQVLEKAVGRPVPHQLVSRGRWRAGNAVALVWREGNILLAGDAAHQVAPSCGVGLSLGIADAMDLAWKLSARFAGWGTSGIVDAYEIERRSLVREVIARLNADRERESEERPFEFHADIALDTPVGRSVRKRLGAQLESRGIGRGSVEQISLRLDGSPIVAKRREDEARSPLLGARAPYVPLPGGRSTLDLVGGAFVLLRLGVRAPEPGGIDRAFVHRGMPLEYRSLDDPSIARLYGHRLVLVRPDGRVAWCGDEPPADPLGLADRLRGAA